MSHTVIYRQAGKAIDYTPGTDMTAGTVVVQDELVGVLVTDTPANTLGSLRTVGEHEFPKDGATAFDAGVNVYWDAVDEEATEDADAGNNKLIGKTTTAALAADATVRVRMSQ